MIGWFILGLIAIGIGALLMFMAADLDDVGRSVSERADGMTIGLIGAVCIVVALLTLIGAGIYNLM